MLFVLLPVGYSTIQWIHVQNLPVDVMIRAWTDRVRTQYNIYTPCTCYRPCSNTVGDHRLSAVVGGEGRGGVHEDEKGVQYDSAATAGVEYDPAATAGVSARAGKEQEEKQARALFGDGSGPMRYSVYLCHLEQRLRSCSQVILECLVIVETIAH